MEVQLKRKLIKDLRSGMSPTEVCLKYGVTQEEYDHEFHPKFIEYVSDNPEARNEQMICDIQKGMDMETFCTKYDVSVEYYKEHLDVFLNAGTREERMMRDIGSGMGLIRFCDKYNSTYAAYVIRKNPMSH